ncbi:MAG: NAD(+) synthase [Clostridiales Family XIII bacterium]|jgi:NAD+ synthase (glutamine-hydrolysing)|nr:NAD(+) synthase [Clostridiales Family XIII bacterium]
MLREGFFRVAAVTPTVHLADCGRNAQRIEEAARAAAGRGARLIVFPELSLTGYTCGDLFLQDTLLEAAKDSLMRLVSASAGRSEVVIVGLPLVCGGKLYNCAAAYADGVLLGIVPKSCVPNYGEFYEQRHFTPADDSVGTIYMPASSVDDEDLDEDDDEGQDEPGFLDEIPFGTNLLFRCENSPELAFAVEICEDLWAPAPPSVRHATAGATVIANLSAGNETIGKAEYRRLLVKSQSGRLLCGYVYANAGFGESSTDMVFSGHSMIGENGSLLAESKPFARAQDAPGTLGGARILLADIDLAGLLHDRRYNTTFGGGLPEEYEEVLFSLPEMELPSSLRGSRLSKGAVRDGNVIPFQRVPLTGKRTLFRPVLPHPFVPSDEGLRAERCEEILDMQSAGLAKRLLHTQAKTAVIGVSGGLDSTLALLVSVRAMRLAGRGAQAEQSVSAVTMPCFGTTDRTKDNAARLCAALGVPLCEIDISASVTEHLNAIGHDLSARDNVFENAQARIRTLVLMDLANKASGLVVGTGDLSELALGWATYNGDHMSMYGVNAGVPKSLVRHIIKYCADAAAGENPALTAVLGDIIDTPVSPELLPPDESGITQRTEEIIGPYELHDFFLYHMLRWGRKPRTIFALARQAFAARSVGISVLDDDRPGGAGGCGGEHPEQGQEAGHAAAPKDRAQYHGKGIYTDEEILRWLRVFYERFFRSQFKRSALPDGPKIGSVTLSPRGDWRMPSDAEVRAWLDDLPE